MANDGLYWIILSKNGPNPNVNLYYSYNALRIFNGRGRYQAAARVSNLRRNAP